MATVIDALLVTLDLDPTQFNEGKKRALEDLTKFRSETEETGKRADQSGKRAGNFFGQIKTAAIGLFTIMGGNAMVQFSQQIIKSEADVGRLAKNLGVATEDLSAWQGVVRQMGGDASDADTALSSLKQTFYDFTLRGSVSPSKLQAMGALGVSFDDLEDPSTAMLKMADAVERLGQPKARQYMRELGIPDSVITTVSKGRKEVEALLAEQRKLSVVNEEAAESGAKFQKSLSEIQQGGEGLWREFVNGVNPALGEFAAEMTALSKDQGVKDFMRESGEWFGRLITVTPEAREFLGDLRRGDWGEAMKDAPSAVWNSLPFVKMTKDAGADKRQADWNRRFPGARTGSSAMEDQLLAGGIPPHVVRGVMAGISAESGMDPYAVNKDSGASFYGQWLGSRKAELLRRYGARPTPQQQIEFLIWELKGGDHGGKSVMSARNETEALDRYIDDFMRPKAGAETIGDKARGRAYLRGNPAVSVPPPGALASNVRTTSNVTITGDIIIQTQATDALGMARDAAPKLREHLAANANRGQF